MKKAIKVVLCVTIKPLIVTRAVAIVQAVATVQAVQAVAKNPKNPNNFLFIGISPISFIKLF